MDFKTYYRSMDRTARLEYAQRASTSCEYIEIHLIPRRKTPTRSTMERLAEASAGAVSYAKVVEYFLLNTEAPA